MQMFKFFQHELLIYEQFQSYLYPVKTQDFKKKFRPEIG